MGGLPCPTLKKLIIAYKFSIFPLKKLLICLIKDTRNEQGSVCTRGDISIELSSENRNDFNYKLLSSLRTKREKSHPAKENYISFR